MKSGTILMIRLCLTGGLYLGCEGRKHAPEVDSTKPKPIDLTSDVEKKKDEQIIGLRVAAVRP